MSLFSNFAIDRLIIAPAVAAGTCAEGNAAIDVPIALQWEVGRTGMPWTLAEMPSSFAIDSHVRRSE